MPDFGYFENHKHFFVVDIIVELRQGKSPRVKSDQMDFAIGQRYSGKDGSKGIVRSIRFNDKQRAWNPVGQDQCSGEGFLQ